MLHFIIHMIREALYNNTVLLLKYQQAFSPEAQYVLTRRFDHESTNYDHSKSLDAKRSVLHPDLKIIRDQPQVQVIGNAFVKEFVCLKDMNIICIHIPLLTSCSTWSVDSRSRANVGGGIAAPTFTCLTRRFTIGSPPPSQVFATDAHFHEMVCNNEKRPAAMLFRNAYCTTLLRIYRVKGVQ